MKKSSPVKKKNKSPVNDFWNGDSKDYDGDFSINETHALWVKLHLKVEKGIPEGIVHGFRL